MRTVHKELAYWSYMFFCAVLLAVVIASVSGCASLGVQPETFRDRTAVVISATTESRNVALTLLQADKITVADAENVQKQADGIIEGVEIARTLHATNATAGESKFAAVSAILAELKKYLALKGGAV